ncbi:hypothetical protein BX600DRAFT_54878 [Xylariales sp. PMI_506]|nr:hypothetical protein BX600DRAFT_54878 [Xylariales sp. PMI_506]
MSYGDETYFIFHDTIFRHGVNLMISAYKDYVDHRSVSATTQMHQRVAFALPNNRLSDKPEVFLVDSTTYFIQLLATVAVWFGKYAELATHVRALKDIIRLRGGNRFLLKRPNIGFYIQCLDLVSTMGNGTTLNIGDDTDTSYSAEKKNGEYINSIKPTILSTPCLPASVGGLIDSRLSTICIDMQKLVNQANTYWNQYQLPDCSAYQSLHGHIQTQLLMLGRLSKDGISECFRLGLLTFLTVTVFRVPSKEATSVSRTRQFPYLSTALAQVCRGTDSWPPRSSQLIFWLLTIGAMAIFDLDNEDWFMYMWTEEAISLPGARLSWDHARGHLKSVLWMDSVHDK